MKNYKGYKIFTRNGFTCVSNGIEIVGKVIGDGESAEREAQRYINGFPDVQEAEAAQTVEEKAAAERDHRRLLEGAVRCVLPRLKRRVDPMVLLFAGIFGSEDGVPLSQKVKAMEDAESAEIAALPEFGRLLHVKRDGTRGEYEVQPFVIGVDAENEALAIIQYLEMCRRQDAVCFNVNKKTLTLSWNQFANLVAYLTEA